MAQEHQHMFRNLFVSSMLEVSYSHGLIFSKKLCPSPSMGNEQGSPRKLPTATLMWYIFEIRIHNLWVGRQVHTPLPWETTQNPCEIPEVCHSSFIVHPLHQIYMTAPPQKWTAVSSSHLSAGTNSSFKFYKSHQMSEFGC